MSETKDTALAAMHNLSPRRNTTEAENVDQLVTEQLVYFGINPATDHGRTLASIAHRRAVRHDILEFSARVLATFPCEILRFSEIPVEFSL